MGTGLGNSVLEKDPSGVLLLSPDGMAQFLARIPAGPGCVKSGHNLLSSGSAPLGASLLQVCLYCLGYGPTHLLLFVSKPQS